MNAEKRKPAGFVRNGILHQPLRIGPFRRCPQCGKWFGLVRNRTEEHPILTVINVYRCRRCGRETGFADSRPIETV